MSTAVSRRLAGFRFEAPPAPLPEALPRMDIAAFVGFAPAGPLDRPVALEDPAHFADVFGGDLELALDPLGGPPLQAQLAPAVRAFFRNGGRRAWVIRVADQPMTRRFPVPGLLRWNGHEFRPAFAAARSPGGGLDGVTIATALGSRSLAVHRVAPDWHSLELVPGFGSTVIPGDLLRIGFTGLDWTLQFVVDAVVPPDAKSPSQGTLLTGRPLTWLRVARASDVPGEAFEAEWTQAPGFGQTPPIVVRAPAVVRAPSSSPVTVDDRLDVDAPVEFLPPPGTQLRLAGGAGTLWLVVDEAHRQDSTESPPQPVARLRGRGFWQQFDAPFAPPSAGLNAAQLTLELRTSRPNQPDLRLVDLGFAEAHPRFWNALPEDQVLYARTDFDSALRAANARPYAALWQDAQSPRFPLAGDWPATDVFLPLGMTGLPGTPSVALPDARTRLEREGLAFFSSALFLDADLRDTGTEALPAEADFLRYQSPSARALRGIHAALELEEVTLIAVPDAIHPGWVRADPPAAPAPVLSDPMPHPSWWHNLPCDPPAVPPIVETPPGGDFLRCDLRLLQSPQLRLAEPPVGGSAFVLAWESPDADVSFVLEEATRPDFTDAVEIERGPDVTRVLYGRATGDYYYRIRAEAGGETSNWSNGLGVSISAGAEWMALAPTARTPATLLGLHRALLRLCAARGELLAVLSLPEDYRDEAAIRYVARLRSPTSGPGETELFPVSLATLGSVPPLGTAEDRVWSYGAVFHPWVIAREEDFTLRRSPPDGTALGVMAQRTVARGAWVAPANLAWRSIVQLSPLLAAENRLDLLNAQINQVRQEPSGFLTLSADTLSLDDDLRPINVRRLLSLLRRIALRKGMEYVFEPNDPSFRRLVHDGFTALLDQLFTRGAFAGDTPGTSYQVVTDESLNPRTRTDLGEFRVDLKVAPSRPMTFLTVRLVQRGERGLTAELS